MSTTEPFPTGTVTFLFTDIEGSTALWEQHGEAMRPALAAHDALLRAAVLDNNGRTVKTTGDGLHAVFASAADGLRAALQAQRDLAAAAWETIAPDRVRVRMGLHTGEAELREGDYYGTHVNRAARLMSLAHGDQVLLSSLSARLVVTDLPPEVELLDLGEHTLRGLTQPERVWQLATAGLRRDFPPLRATAVVRGNLPARVSSFVGRARELALVKERLAETRLLTLVGPGGTGKTRLSLQLAAGVQGAYQHGVWWVELAPVTDPDLVPAAVAGALGISAGSGQSVEEAVIDYLREKEALIILDNCEHLISAAAHLAAALIENGPRLTVLASSREGLGVYGEMTIHLAPLTLPDAGTDSAEDARLSEAVQLFVERARATKPGFDLRDDNAPAVVQIVRRLDGIPLAIELAAARITVFDAAQIATRLDDRFRLLTGGSRTALPRQQTLRALIDWSYDLLDEDERTLLRRLSVFLGGWTFEAAEYMAGELDVYTILPALVNKSLVTVVDKQTDPWGETETEAPPRYAFLETIRQYARDRLVEAGEVETSRDRHFDYFVELSDGLAFGLELKTQPLLSGGLLLLEKDNLAAAVAWGLDRYPERVIDLCWQLSIFLSDQNPGAEGARWVRAALERLEQLPPGDPEEMARRRSVMLKGKIVLALLLVFLGEMTEGLRLTDEILPALRAGEGSQQFLVMTLFIAAQAGYFVQRPGVAERAREAAELLRRGVDGLNDPAFLALTLIVQAAALESEGDVDRANELLAEAEALYRDRTSTYYVPWSDYIVMRVRWSRYEDLMRQESDLHRALARLREHRSYRMAAMLESDWAHALREAGDRERAMEMYRRTILQWQHLGHRAAVANQLEVMAFVYRTWEEPARAAQLLGAAERLREEAGQAMLPPEREVYDREVALLRAMLPADELAELWGTGRAMSTDAAVELATAPDL